MFQQHGQGATLIGRRQILALGGLLPLALATGCRRKVTDPEVKDKPKPETPPPPAVKADEIEFDYAIQVLDGPRVPQDHEFKSGDRFKVVVRPDFNAYVYLFNRGSGDGQVQKLFPHPGVAISNPLPGKKETTLPDKAPYRFDERPGTEYFVIVVATMPVPEFDSISGAVSREKFDLAVAAIEQQAKPQSMRQFQDADWTKVILSPSTHVAAVIQAPLKHS